MVMNPETTSKESNTKSSTRSSSFSSVSSSDLPRVDTDGPSKSGTYTTSSSKPELDSQSALNHVSVPGNSSRSKELDNGSPVSSSISPATQVTHETSVYDLPSTQSPPLQVMDRSEGYNHLRIPSTVFESKVSSPLEWSAASNESLFSLHLGDNSFSRDDVFIFDGEVLKSGEIPKSGEFLKFSPAVTVDETEGKSLEWEKGEEIRESGDGIKVSTIDTAEDQSTEKGPPTNGTRRSSDFSNHSNESIRSFAFPIMSRVKRCAWPSCYCSDCSRTFCYCSMPRCYCSDCSWAFCYYWNCSLNRWCCHSSTPKILTEEPEGSSVTAEVENNPNKQLFDKMASTSSTCCCFSWSSCHPCCSSRCYYCF